MTDDVYAFSTFNKFLRKELNGGEMEKRVFKRRLNRADEKRAVGSCVRL